MSPREAQAGKWVRVACLSAAMLALLLLALGASFWHQDAPGSEATCAICHLAHLTAAQGPLTTGLSVPLVFAWYLPSETHVPQAAPKLPGASPRAPPA